MLRRKWFVCLMDRHESMVITIIVSGSFLSYDYIPGRKSSLGMHPAQSASKTFLGLPKNQREPDVGTCFDTFSSAPYLCCLLAMFFTLCQLYRAGGEKKIHRKDEEVAFSDGFCAEWGCSFRVLIWRRKEAGWVD